MLAHCVWADLPLVRCCCNQTSGFKCYCAKESRRGLIYYPSTTTMALQDFAFPFGRPRPAELRKKRQEEGEARADTPESESEGV